MILINGSKGIASGFSTTLSLPLPVPYQFASAHLAMCGEPEYKIEIINELLRADHLVVGHDAPGALAGAMAGGEGVIRLWDTETKAQVLAIRTNSATTNYLAFTPDGNTLVSHGSQERIRFWDATPVER